MENLQNNLLFISMIVPCRNEEAFIGEGLNSLIAQNYSKDSLEVLLADGMSKDNAQNILQSSTEKYTFINILDNPEIISSSAFNKGIANARGDLIALISAHLIYSKDYIFKCVRYMQEYNTNNVGGILEIIPKCDTFIANAIANGVSHPFASGNSYVKVGTKKTSLGRYDCFWLL